MDNFRRNKNLTSHSRPSIDGFVGARPKPKPQTHKLANSAQSGLRSRRGNIGAFRSTEGFGRFKSPSIATEERDKQRHRTDDVDDHVKLDLPPAKKRSTLRGKNAPKKKKHVLRKAVSSFMILFLVGGGYMFGKGYFSLLNVFRGGGSALALNDNLDPAKLKGEGDGRVNVLLLGRGGEGHEGADLTDTIIVASIDPINKKAALLSIPRDLYIKTADYGAMKINAAFATGKNYDAAPDETPDQAGLRFVESTIEDTIGIPIHYNVLVDFDGFKEAVDNVGGVTIDVPEDLAVTDYMHYYGPYTLDVDAGASEFDGLRALMFSRTRKTSARGDFDRSERQRLVMVALKDKVFSLGTFSNPVKVNQLLSTLGSHISSSFTTEEVLRVYEIMQEIPNSEIASVGLADEPNSFVTTDNIGGLSVVVPKAGLFNFDAIKNYVRNELRDGYLADENALIDVYNASFVTGLAGRTASELESFGYTVGKMDNAPTQGQAETVLVDLSGGSKKYTKAYLEKRFNVTAVTTIPDAQIVAGEADFVILLGQNEESRLQN